MLKRTLTLITVLMAFSAIVRADEPKKETTEKPKPTPEAGEVGTLEEGPKRIVSWDDEETGAHYLFLPQARNFSRTSAACRNRGWEVFTLKHLSADERERFYDSPLFKAIPWTVRFKGDPGEIRELGIWMGSEKSDYAGTTTELLIFKERKVDHKRHITIEERMEGGMDDSVKHASVCMFRGEEWHKCNVETACVHEELAYSPSPPHFYPIGNHRETVYDEGETEAQARAFLLKRATWSWSSEDSRRKQSCTADMSTMSCEKVR